MTPPTRKHQIIVATPKGSDKVVGWFDLELGSHYTAAELANERSLICSRTDAVLGLKWVHGDYRGITPGEGLLGAEAGRPYNVNLAITEAGMQVLEIDGHQKVTSVFATDEGLRSGQKSGFETLLETAPTVVELQMANRQSWETRVEAIGRKVEEKKAAAPGC